MEFIEAPLFAKYVYDYFDDEEYAALQWYLAEHPEAGDVIPKSGGLRKVRWKAEGRGKRGGTRIIYYYKNQENEIWLLTIYAKNEMETLSSKELQALRQELLK